MTHREDHPHHSHGHQPTPPWWKRSHKDWRVWVVVILMLAAMVIYILTLDESLWPRG
jgi:hypothetical protein